MPFTLLGGIILFVALLSCDTPSTSVTEEPDLLNKNAIQAEAKISVDQLQWVKPGSKKSKNGGSYNICYIWRAGENGQEDAEAHVWQVIFPNKITKTTGSETTRFIYKKANGNGELIRYAGCIVPDSEDAIKLIRKAFDGNHSGSQPSNRQSNDGTLTIMSDCGDYECELEWDSSRQEYVCTAPPCDSDGDEENGDGPPPFGGGGGGEEEEDDPPIGGGGGDTPGDGGGGDYDEELPEFLEPCETGNAHLDNIPFQYAMYQAWSDSYGTDENPYDHDQRNEGIIIVTAISSGYKFDVIPPEPGTSSCHFDGGTYSVQTNTVALIHTHPYGHGDTINDSRCPSGTYNGNNVSSKDAALMQSLNNGGFNIPIYVIDETRIRVIQPSNPSQYAQTINRCGY